MTNDDSLFLLNTIERVCELEALVVPETKATFPYPLEKHTTFPYWVNFPVAAPPTDGVGTMLQSEIYSVRMRIVIGHLAQGSSPNLQKQLWVWLPQVVEFFTARPQLELNSEQKALRYLSPQGCSIRVARPFGIFTDTPDQHIGAEWELTVPFIRENLPAF